MIETLLEGSDPPKGDTKAKGDVEDDSRGSFPLVLWNHVYFGYASSRIRCRPSLWGSRRERKKRRLTSSKNPRVERPRNDFVAGNDAFKLVPSSVPVDHDSVVVWKRPERKTKVGYMAREAGREARSYGETDLIVCEFCVALLLLYLWISS